MKKFHFIYKTTNLVNGKYYIGAHSTDNLNDGYLGSGVGISRAIKRYGAENFKRDILEFVNSEEEKWKCEIDHITPEIVQDDMSYNQVAGGKNWIAAMKRTGDERLKQHQSKAGKIGSDIFLKSLNEDQLKKWHRAGGHAGGSKCSKLKIGIHTKESIEKKNKAVSLAIQGTIELWHPEAPLTVTNRNSPGYKSGWSKRVKKDSEQYKILLEKGYVYRGSQLTK